MEAGDKKLAIGDELMLIDGHALIYRAFHALPPLSTTKGELTNAVFGFTSMVLKAMQELQPEYVACTFDRPNPTFRHDEFKGYKAQRPPMPSELVGQLARVRQVVDVLRLPVFELDGYEADDLIGTLSKQAAAQGVLTTIVTGDFDTLQLVQPLVRVYAPRTGMSDTVIYDEERVRERFGVAPPQMVDFKALRGDPSDNIPGVPGFGEKTSRDLVARYGSIEGIYERLSEIKGKQREQLEQYKGQVLLGKRLATIIDAPVRLDLEACRRPDYDRSAAVDLFRDLEFSSLVPRLPPTRLAVVTEEPGLPLYGSQPAPRPVGVAAGQIFRPAPWWPEGGAPSPFRAGEGLAFGSATQLAERLRASGACSFKVVTTRQRAMEGDTLGMALVCKDGPAYVKYEDMPALKDVLEDEQTKKAGHDLKFDVVVLRRCGIELRGIAFDTSVAYALVTNRTPDLKAMSLQELHEELAGLADLTGTGAKAASLADMPLQQVAEAACREVTCAWRLVPLLEHELKDKALHRLFLEVELPLIPVLAEMEFNGVTIDIAHLRELAVEFDHRIRALETDIYSQVGHEFKVGSTQQLGQVLFSELHLPGGKRTKTGYSTDASVLEELADLHPVVGKVLEWRQLCKLKSTYIDALPRLVDRHTGRVHTSFSQVTATTGRLSSSDPNLQNIPIRTDLGPRIRKAFVCADPSWYLLSADYSQIELRILAHVTGDVNLINAFQRQEDIHATTAAFVFKVPLEQVTGDMRRVAKMVNFGIAYGLSEFGLAKGTGMSREQAGEFIGRYFETYPGIRRYMQETRRDAHELGYVCTLLNRRRYLREIHAASYQLRSAAERMAINMPIQGTAADIIKLAMIRLYQEMRHRRMCSRMILQVHDELVFEVPEEEVDGMARLARETMEGALHLSVPLVVELKLGRNWGEMQAMGRRFAPEEAGPVEVFEEVSEPRVTAGKEV